MPKKIVLMLLMSVVIFFLSFYIKRLLSKKENYTSLKRDKMTTIRLKETVVNIGDVPLKSENKVRSAFTIYNTGPNDLIITDVKPDCKCTVGFVEKNKIIPVNDSTNVFLDYKPSYEGTFQVSATIELNVESAPLLVMRGNVVP
ncbi:MAG: DUF1573 domain-containing protein [Agriterribacter sp.]